MLKPGQRVRVREDWPETRSLCHVRTPHYVRGVFGVIEGHLGRFRNPEDGAFLRPAALLDLYHVRFDQASIWDDGRDGDEVMVEIYESWLEPA